MVAAVASGCRTTIPDYELAQWDSVRQVDQALSEAVPAPVPGEPASAYLRFALLNNPRIRAAFRDWQASVAAVTPARSLPDPRLTFESSIADTVMTLMPGIMFDFPGAGKRAARGEEAAAAGQVLYREYVATLLATAAEVRRAWADLKFVDDALTLREQALGLIEQSAAIAEADFATGRGMLTLERQIGIQTDLARLRTDIAILQDRRAAARVRFKSALGLRREDADPAWPSDPFPTAESVDPDSLWRELVNANPQLASLRAMVDLALSSVEVARLSGSPDFSLGLMADLRANPLMVRPSAAATLPIWRDQVDAVIASAEARQLAAAERLDAARAALAADLAQALLQISESERTERYLVDIAIPNTTRARAAAEAGYQTGAGSFAPVVDLQFRDLELRMEQIAAQRQRELAFADLSFLTAGRLPDPGLLAAFEQ